MDRKYLSILIMCQGDDGSELLAHTLNKILHCTHKGYGRGTMLSCQRIIQLFFKSEGVNKFVSTHL